MFDDLYSKKREQEAHYKKNIKKHHQKEKLRKASRKIGKSEKDKRSGSLQDDFDRHDDSDWEESMTERITPRGEQERRRDLEKALFDDPQSSLEVSLPLDEQQGQEEAGLVVGVSSGFCRVVLDDEEILCSLRGSLKAVETGYTNIVAVGDRVRIHLDGQGRGVVETIQPRRSLLVRPDVQSPHLKQVVVANADQMLIVAAWRDPYIWLELIDRYLIAAQRSSLEPILCINKTDLSQDAVEIDLAVRPYFKLGIPVVLTSAHSGAGIERLAHLVYGKLSVVVGLSGVGKSTLLSAIQPGLNLRTAEVSQAEFLRGSGRHTTTQASLYPLHAGGAIIDTPGVREFGLAGLTRRELAAYFPEFQELADQCPFNDCSHTHEPDCAVLQAVADNRIAASRYHSYTCIRKELPA
ncbi:MAG: ribosome small subunit-dependent GTPase A [Anaerolineaceae bacterium]|nr:ribosome small subunit-dependent GTPase A [Anaerolineaceae bacterium]